MKFFTQREGDGTSFAVVNHLEGMLSMKNRCFFSIILNFHSTFFHVKKNSIFDRKSRVEEKHCFFQKTSFSKKHRFLLIIYPPVELADVPMKKYCNGLQNNLAHKKISVFVSLFTNESKQKYFIFSLRFVSFYTKTYLFLSQKPNQN
jgi:hypothetical protein